MFISFIGWSGRGKAYAQAVKEFLEACFQSHIVAEMSADIPSGSDWTEELPAQLLEADYGILCITRGSRGNWMCYEAGALFSKNVRVTPILFGTPAEKLFAPLRHLQYRNFNKEDMKRMGLELCGLIYDAEKGLGLENKDCMGRDAFLSAFETAYQELESKVTRLREAGFYTLESFQRDLDKLRAQGVDEWITETGNAVLKELSQRVPLEQKAESLKRYREGLARHFLGQHDKVDALYELTETLTL